MKLTIESPISKEMDGNNVAAGMAQEVLKREMYKSLCDQLYDALVARKVEVDWEVVSHPYDFHRKARMCLEVGGLTPTGGGMKFSHGSTLYDQIAVERKTKAEMAQMMAGVATQNQTATGMLAMHQLAQTQAKAMARAIDSQIYNQIMASVNVASGPMIEVPASVFDGLIKGDKSEDD